MLAKLFSFWNSPTGRISVPRFLVLSLLTPAYPQTPSDDLTQMNIEELINVEVTSVSGHEQSLSKTAAAIFVITEEEILRSGATNIRDLLRMVPGVQVAQINASSWAVSIRGSTVASATKCW
jgi:iron complex outermembrane receptor protein